MQIKNKIFITFCYFLFFITFNLNAKGEEFNISAIEVSVDKTNNIVIGKGSVEVVDKEGKIIKTDKATYKKNKEYIHEFRI